MVNFITSLFQADILVRTLKGLQIFLISVCFFSCATFRSGSVYEKGPASWYGKQFNGHRTASGERYNMKEMTAAHPTLPFGTKVQVKRVSTGQTVKVRINDRGPYRSGRIIDLSYAAAAALGIVKKGED